MLSCCFKESQKHKHTFEVTIIPPAIAGQLAYHAPSGTDAASLVHLGCNLHVTLDCHLALYRARKIVNTSETEDAGANAVPLAKDLVGLCWALAFGFMLRINSQSEMKASAVVHLPFLNMSEHV